MQVAKALLLSNMLSSTENVENADIATFVSSCVSTPDITVDLEPIQDLHGYDYPWPAGGGKNKFAIGDAIGVIPAASYGLSVTLNDISETIHIQGTPTWTTSGSKNFRVVSYVSGNYFGDAPVTHDYSGLTGKWFVVSKSSNVSSINDGTNPTSDGTIGIMLSVTDGGSVDIVLKLFLYEGSTAPTSWTPYSNICPISGRSEVNVYVEESYDPQATPKVTIQLGQTVYGAKVDVTRGKMVIDRALVDMGTRTWTYIQPSTAIPYGAFYNTIQNKKPGQTNLICSAYPVKQGFINDRAIQGNTGASTVYVTDSTYNGDENALKTAVTGQTICYELATPVEVTLTPQQIQTLVGENNIWSDSGNISVLNITCTADFLDLFLKTKLIGDC